MNRCNLPVDFEAYQQTKMKGIPVTRYVAERGVAYLQGRDCATNYRVKFPPIVGKIFRQLSEKHCIIHNQCI